MEASLVVLEGIHKGRVIPLPETIFMIGRDPQCHLRPHCPSVSRLHCAVAAWAGKVRLRDLKSSNGTLLNDKPIDGEVAVEDGDRVQIGALHFEFRIGNAHNVAPPPPVHEKDVKWLLDSPNDSEVLEVGTCELPFPPAIDDASALAQTTRTPANPDAQPSGSNAVSAGGHLRTYIETRKQQ